MATIMNFKKIHFLVISSVVFLSLGVTNIFAQVLEEISVKDPTLTVQNCETQKVEQFEAETIFKSEEVSRDEKIDLSACLVKDTLTPSFYERGGYSIEITDTKIIPNGIEVFARVFQDGNQIGFGSDGTVDIERFQFINPNVLIKDDGGSLLIPTYDDKGKVQLKSASVDPKEYILRRLEHVFSIKKEFYPQSEKIVSGKIGNTTTIVDYEYNTGANGSTQVVADAKATYILAQGAATGDAVYTIGTNGTHNFLHNSLSGGSYYVRKGDLVFDTSAIPDTDEISSAILTIFSATTGGSNTDGDTLVLLDNTNNANIQNPMATEDFNDFTSTSIGSLAMTSLNNIGANVSITLTDYDVISKTAYSRIGLRFQKEISNTTPTGSNILRISTGTAGDDPFLTIEHAAPATSTPTTTTSVAQYDYSQYFDLFAIFFGIITFFSVMFSFRFLSSRFI